MKFNACQIPLEIDIWNEIEDELKTGFKNILSVGFCYIAASRQTFVTIKHQTNGEPSDEIISLDNEELVLRLCKRFNIPEHTVSRLNFTLIPGKIPIFWTGLYPYVNDISTLDAKSRMNPKTID